MESNNIQTKVNKIGKAGKIVSIVLIVLLSIGALALVLGGIACAILPKDLVEVNLRPVVDVKVDKELMGTEWANIDKLLDEAQKKAGEEFEGAGVALEKTDKGLLVHVDPKDEADATFGLRDALKAIWAGFIGIASAIVTLVMFLQLCKAFQACRSPFDEPVIHHMNTFAWTLIVCAVASCFARASVAAILSGWQRMSFNLNLTSVFTALFVFFLCMVFRYGAQLQRMSLNELSEKVGVANVNLSKLKNGHISAIRFSTLIAICEALHCQPGDILEYSPEE